MAELEYQPRGRGFELRLSVDSLDMTVTGSGLDDRDPEISGSVELTSNVALRSQVLTFAANELAYRRSRSPEKRKSHRRAADAAGMDARALAVLVARLDDTETVAWCSGCFSRASRRYVRGRDRPARTYLCGECGTPTAECAVPNCRHHAVVSPTARVTLCYCAEHHHEIPGFEKLNDEIPTLSGYRAFLKYESVNADRVTKVAGGTVGAAIAIAPLAFFAAPALGAALGSSVLGGSLTGAAATSHGLAMLGGGAVASGGLGMVAGTVVVSATGTALGGALGAATVSAYTSADKSFAIEEVRPGVGTPVVFATGFLTEGHSAWSDWQRLVDQRYPEAPVYQVHWGAKELKDLTALLVSTGVKSAIRSLLVQWAKRGSLKFSLPGLGWVLSAHEIATNPWTVARTRAEMTGAALAALLARANDGPYVLMGHSLGARVMVTAAQGLATQEGPSRVESMHLMGAAVARKGDWRLLAGCSEGPIWNYWSSNDEVLKWLYRWAEGGQEAAGHGGFLTKYPSIKNRNVSRQVSHHSGYVPAVTLGR